MKEEEEACVQFFVVHGPRLVRVDCFECVLDEYFWKRWDYEIFGWYFFLTSAIIFAHNLRDAVFGPYSFGPH